MTEQAHVAILLAAYNGVTFIEQQLNSILRQNSVAVTIFISVDVSTDGSYEWCCNYAQDRANINILPYGERFGGAAPNFFRLIRDVDFSSFDYIALADQDDIWLDDKSITACTHMRKNNLAAYSSNVLAFWGDGREKLIDKAQPQRKYDYLFESAGPGCSYVLKAEPLLEFKNFLLSNKENINKVALHDWLIYAFFRAHGYSWFIDPKYKLRYRQHENNQVGINKGWHAAIKRLKLFKNGWYKQQVVLISELISITNISFDSRWIMLKNIGQLRRHWQDRAILFILVLVGVY